MGGEPRQTWEAKGSFSLGFARTHSRWLCIFIACFPLCLMKVNKMYKSLFFFSLKKSPICHRCYMHLPVFLGNFAFQKFTKFTEPVLSVCFSITEKLGIGQGFFVTSADHVCSVMCGYGNCINRFSGVKSSATWWLKWRPFFLHSFPSVFPEHLRVLS